jgi:hypothetical protein
MSKRYDIMAPRKGRDKTFWTRIGTAFEGDKGIQLIFDALPLPDAEGRCVANLFEPRARDGSQGSPSPREPVSADLDDDVPFMSGDPSLEWRVR